jgi:hypothetical protein
VWEKKQKRTGGPWRVSGAGGSLLTSGWERPWWAPGRWRGSGHEAPGAIRSVARAPLARGRPGGGARAAASGRRRGEGSGRARACLFALGGGGARHVTPSRARRSKWAGGGGQATLLCAACARPRPHARTQSKQQRRRAGRPVLGGGKPGRFSRGRGRRYGRFAPSFPAATPRRRRVLWPLAALVWSSASREGRAGLEVWRRPDTSTRVAIRRICSARRLSMYHQSMVSRRVSLLINEITRIMPVRCYGQKICIMQSTEYSKVFILQSMKYASR